MTSKLFLLVLAALCVSQTSAIFCRPPRFPCNRIPIRPVTVPTLFTTPSMVDAQSLNFTHPSVIAKDCINSLGKSMVGFCQAKAEADWDPDKMNTTTSTTWETCCALYEELDCYVSTGGFVCPDATKNALAAYSRKVAAYFTAAICPLVRLPTWRQDCNNITHNLIVQRVNQSISNNPNYKPVFVNLPKDDGPEKACFNKLRTAVVNSTTVNLEKRCQDTSLDKWDPNRRKITESAILESCCAIYDSLDCIQRESVNTCSQSEQTDMASYQKKSLAVFSQTICKTVPYDKSARLCSGKTSGAAAAIPPTLLTLFLTFVLFVKINL